MKSLAEIRLVLSHKLPFVLQGMEQEAAVENGNEHLQSFASMLAGLLYLHLKERDDKWNGPRWIDDCIINRMEYKEGVLKVWGIVISGVGHTTQQWTDPLYAEMEFDKSGNVNKYRLYFSDRHYEPVAYDTFSNDRGCWDRDYYADNSWNPEERNWEYMITKE